MDDPTPPGDTLDRLRADIIGCRACPRLVEWRERVAREKRAAYRDETYWGRPVPGFGDPRASILVVGLAPAAHGANRTGRMFTGDRSGDFLYASLFRAGLANQPTSEHAGDGLRLDGVYITAPVRCAPPANKPTPAERDNCRPFLQREFVLLDSVRVIVALGALALGSVAAELGLHPRPKFAHGLEVEVPGTARVTAKTLLASYHVSQQNTFTGRLTEPMLDAIWTRARELVAVRRGA